MSGKMVAFKANGGTANGYLAVPGSGSGPAVIVLQEYWGLVPHIKDIADRFAKAGFVALAPDLYDGEATSSPDQAGKLMMALQIEQTEKQLAGAVNFLLSLEETRGDRVGTVGFCMGGQLSLYAACANEKVGACVDFYGIHPHVKPDLNKLKAPVLGFFADRDEYVPPAKVHELEQALKAAGKAVDFTIFSATEHAFFNNTRPEVYHEANAATCWTRMLAFLTEHL